MIHSGERDATAWILGMGDLASDDDLHRSFVVPRYKN